MKLNDIAEFVTDKISSGSISLDRYVTTDSLLQNRRGRETAQNLPPMPCALTHYRQGDVLVANIRPYLKKVWYADSEGGCSSDVLVFRAKNGHCSSFLYTVLMQDAFFDYAMSGAKGSKMPRGDKDQIMRYELPTLTPMEEENIGNMMVDIMSKINVNRQINDNLEAIAKQLYDYWFVQFDFPNEEGKPYKSSGGAMVWNEKLKREIPQGLGTPKIGDIEKNIITGKTPSCADEDNFGGDIPFVTIDDIRGNLFVFEAQRTLSTKGADSQEKKYLPIGSLSVSCIGTIGVMGFVARLAQTNQQINSIVFEHEYNKEFLYFSLKLYYENAKAKTGNVFANMSKEEFASIIVAYPPKQILQAFHNKVAPIFDSIKNNIEEINSLTKQRDELLPLLMNSQAMVNYHLSVVNVVARLPFYRRLLIFMYCFILLLLSRLSWYNKNVRLQEMRDVVKGVIKEVALKWIVTCYDRD